MSSDIDQLRADIATLEAAAKIETNCRGTNHLLWHEIDMLSSRLSEAEEVAKLEADVIAKAKGEAE